MSEVSKITTVEIAELSAVDRMEALIEEMKKDTSFESKASWRGKIQEIDIPFNEAVHQSLRLLEQEYRTEEVRSYCLLFIAVMELWLKNLQLESTVAKSKGDRLELVNAFNEISGATIEDMNSLGFANITAPQR